MTDRLSTLERHFRRPLLDPKSYQRIIYDPGMVTRIILNRPRYLNATSHAVLAELDDAFDRASEDENCHVIVLSGNGSSFCAGDDVIGLSPEGAPTLWDGAARTPEKLLAQYGSESAVWHQYNIEHDYFIGWPFLSKIRMCPKPTIAMVHGYVVFMGYMLSQACDLVFASEDALFLGAGGVKGLWSMGPHKLMELAFEHRFMTAAEALENRIVNRVFPNFETLERETMAFAYRVADQNPIAIRRAKESILNMEDMLGYTTVNVLQRTPYATVWREWAAQGHRMRYEGRGIARTPVALANLAAKLESEGKPVPEHVRAAIDRAASRDDKGTWQKALHQGWRSQERLARTDASAAAYEAYITEHEAKKQEEIKRRGLDIWEQAKVAAQRIKTMATTRVRESVR
jgi:enoyl-CoA hydratase